MKIIYNITLGEVTAKGKKYKLISFPYKGTGDSHNGILTAFNKGYHRITEGNQHVIKSKESDKTLFPKIEIFLQEVPAF